MSEVQFFDGDLAALAVELRADDLGRQCPDEPPSGPRLTGLVLYPDGSVVTADGTDTDDNVLKPLPQLRFRIASGRQEHAPLAHQRLILGAADAADHAVVAPTLLVFGDIHLDLEAVDLLEPAVPKSLRAVTCGAVERHLKAECREQLVIPRHLAHTRRASSRTRHRFRACVVRDGGVTPVRDRRRGGRNDKYRASTVIAGYESRPDGDQSGKRHDREQFKADPSTPISDTISRSSTVESLLTMPAGLVANTLSPILVDNDAEVASGQITRRSFLEKVHATVVSVGDERLARVGRSTQDCPYIQHWLARCETYSAPALEQLVHLVARPRTRSVDGYLDAIAATAAERVDGWIAGERPDSPESFEHAVSQLDIAEPVQLKQDSTLPKGDSRLPTRTIGRLGPGQAFTGAARQQMESGFGASFGDVRIHTDSAAGRVARERGALAVTVGRHVVFAPGRYQLDTLDGQALLAHELAHTIQQRSGGTVGASAEKDYEEDADSAAAHVVGRSLGLAPSGSARPRRWGGLALRSCAPANPLSSTEEDSVRAGVTAVAGSTPIIEAAIRDAYGESFGNIREDPEIVAGTHLALTKNGYTRLATSSLSLPPGRLGALIVHEMSHLRDPPNAMGLAEAMEGYAYAFEIVLLRRALAAMKPNDPERQGFVDRIAVVEGLYSKPPTLPNLASAYRGNYDAMTSALELLYRVIDGVPIVWGPSGEPPGWSPMASDKAQRTITWLLRTDSTELRSKSGGFGADLLQWVVANQLEVLKILNPPPPAPPPTAAPPPPAPPPPPSGSSKPFRPPKRPPLRKPR